MLWEQSTEHAEITKPKPPLQSRKSGRMNKKMAIHAVQQLYVLLLTLPCYLKFIQSKRKIVIGERRGDHCWSLFIRCHLPGPFSLLQWNTDLQHVRDFHRTFTSNFTNAKNRKFDLPVNFLYWSTVHTGNLFSKIMDYMHLPSSDWALEKTFARDAPGVYLKLPTYYTKLHLFCFFFFFLAKTKEWSGHYTVHQVFEFTGNLKFISS